MILTKLDGDARGGAALSVRSVTGRPIKYVSVGEKLDQLEEFHPDRMASRILGMGDVLTLIEKAEAAVEEDEQAAMEARMRAGIFTFDDFLQAQKMLKKMGPLQGVMKMIPGLGNQLKDVDIDEQQLARVEAIVLSMTPQAEPAAPDRRLPQAADRGRQRADDPGREQAPLRPQADGEDDEADGEGKMPTSRPAEAHQDRTEIDRMAVRMRLTRVGSKKNPIYRVVVADQRSRATAASSRSSGATTRRRSRRRSSSTRRR